MENLGPEIGAKILVRLPLRGILMWRSVLVLWDYSFVPWQDSVVSDIGKRGPKEHENMSLTQC